jgi:hypothetical protein
MKSNGPSDRFTKIAATHATDYTVADLTDGKNFLFMLRANNVCGYIESHPLTVQVGRYAAPSAAGSITTSNGNAVITWQITSATTGSEVEIKNNMGIFERVIMCGQFNEFSCTFHMSTLKNAPFNLAEGSAFEGRVRTCSMAECSDWIALENSNKLRSIPPVSIEASSEMLEWINQYSAPVNSVELSWINFAQNYFHESDIRFRLDVCKGLVDCTPNSANWEEITMTAGSTQSVAWVAGQDLYQFRVTACNSAGCSKSCTPLPVRRVRPAHACACPTVSVKQAFFVSPTETTPKMVAIQWKRPNNNGGAPVEEYKVEVKGIKGFWHDVSAHCARYTLTRILTCHFEQSKLEAFGVVAGVEIRARVSAKNQAGWSKTTENCRGNIVTALPTPPPMNPPVVTPLIHGSLEVCYKAHYQSTSYTISWSSATQPREVREINNAEDNCELIPSLVPGTKYNICIRSDNTPTETCRTVTVARPPGNPECKVAECDPIKITCSCTDAGTSAVVSYQVQVKKAASDNWVIYPNCGLTGGSYLNCEIPHAWLAANTGHAEGE